MFNVFVHHFIFVNYQNLLFIFNELSVAKAYKETMNLNWAYYAYPYAQYNILLPVDMSI